MAKKQAFDESQLDWYEPARGTASRPGLWVSIGMAGQMRLSPELSAKWPEKVHYGMVARTYDGQYLFIRPSRENLSKCLTFRQEKEKKIMVVGVSGLMSKYQWELTGPTVWPAEVTDKGDFVVDLAHPLHVGQPVQRGPKGKTKSCLKCLWCLKEGQATCGNESSEHHNKPVTAIMSCRFCEDA